MDMQFDEWRTLLNKETGEVVSISNEQLSAAEELDDYEDEASEDLEAAENKLENLDEEMQLAFDIYSNFEKYEDLPDRDHINEYGMMEDFCYQIQNDSSKEKLLRAIQGKGAFRRFKDQVNDLGIEQQWYDFRDEQYKQVAIKWCRDLDLEFEE
jgi:hypothetical protein